MRAAVLAAIMACGVSAEARAAVETFSASLGTFDPYYSERDQVLPGFDATLGTLNSITVSTRAFLSEAVQVQAAAGAAFPGTGSFKAIYNAQVIPTPAADRSVLTQSVSTAIAADGTGLVTAGFTDSFTVPVADYSATGPLTIRYDIFAQPQGGLSFLFDDSSRTTASGTVTVSYNYAGTAGTAVPEPASWALLGVALVLMRHIRRSYGRATGSA
jgi:hypothetical protein